MTEPQKKKRDSSLGFDVERFSHICKALGHSTRIEIVLYLKKINRCVCQEIVDVLPLSQSTVSQHLKVLKEAGVIQGEVEGPCTCYCLNPKVITWYKKIAQIL